MSAKITQNKKYPLPDPLTEDAREDIKNVGKAISAIDADITAIGEDIDKKVGIEDLEKSHAELLANVDTSLEDVVAALNGKADKAHKHDLSGISGLQAALDENTSLIMNAVMRNTANINGLVIEGINA